MRSIVAKPKWYKIGSSSSSRTDQNILILYSKCSKPFAILLASFFDKKQLFEIDKENLESALNFFLEGGFDAIYFASNNENLFEVDPNQEAILLLKILQRFALRTQVTLKVITQNAVKIEDGSGFLCPLNAALIGLTQTASKEFPNWQVFFINVDGLDQNTAVQIAKETGESNPNQDPIAFSNGIRFLRRLSRVSLQQSENTKFTFEGTYVIVGGAKGIGFELSKYLSKSFKANLILIGRSQEDKSKIEEVNKLGGKADYHQIDICDFNSLSAFFDDIKEADGVIHSALVLEDKTILNMDEEIFEKVLNPKILGSINLFLATAKKKIGFYLFFSSFQSFIANPGQSNYSSASTFQDAWAEFLRETYVIDARVINWSFWGSIGVVAQEKYRKRMAKLEIGSIEPEEGIEKIEAFLSSDFDQLAVIKASENALQNLHLELNNACKIENNTPLNIAELMPRLDLNDPHIKRNVELQEALEMYSRWVSTQIKLDNPINKYDRLVQAIKNISCASKPIEEDQFLKNYPELKGHIHLLNHCLRNYSEVLQGKIDHMQVLFPDGSFDLVKAIYQNNAMADYFNERIAEVLKSFLKMVKKKIKVLEIGAGTGSTTEKLLSLIQKYEIDYVFSDISLGFTNVAKKKWKESYPSMTFCTLNIEKESSFDEDFDVIIATNVLHATKDIRSTLKNVSRLLNDEGILIINEVTDRQDFATLTFGLTSGWWLFNDEYRIPDSPLVNGENWKKLLGKAGFQQIESHGSQLQQLIVGCLATNGMKHETTKSIQKSSETSHPLSSKQLQMEDFLMQTIAQVMKFSQEDMNTNSPFSEQGIDSLIVLEILKPLQEKFGYLPTTLLFEYPNIKALAEFFVKEYPEKSPELLHPPLIHDKKNYIDFSDGDEIQNFLRLTIANVMKISIDEIENEKSFSEYGIDSLIVLELLKPLQKKVGYLPSTLFFEYINLKSLTEYFLNHHADAFRKQPKPNLEEKHKAIITSSFSVSSDKYIQEEIAIIGMAGRFPKAKNLEEFWKQLTEGYHGIVEIPSERWDWQEFTDETGDRDHLSYTKYGAFLENIACFDHEFFNITPLDAEKIDPQERLFLETTYHAFEDAGYNPKKISKNTGVFVGVMNPGYSWLGVDSKKTNDADSPYWSIANRVSYYFDLNGPSMSLDSACSSSLSALHLAVQSIRSKECESAVVGGVNLILHPRQLIKLSRLHMLSKKGRCSPFGIDADGFVDGEGIISIVLKPFSKAIEDQDRIYSVIKGSALNSGGKTSGYTVPNPNAQKNLIIKALKNAHLSPNDISYIEAHGTGTVLGDPIEISGLAKVFGHSRDKKLTLGSVKGNIGHLESAAGLAGVVKVAMQLYNKQLVPSIHSKKLNPHLDLPASFAIQHTFEPWDINISGQRAAGVSSFGAGGANAHVILGEKNHEDKKMHCSVYILPLSANSQASLQKKLISIMHLLNSKELDIYALVYTFSCCKENFKYRLAFVFETLEDLKSQINKQFSLNNSNKLSVNEKSLQELIFIFNDLNTSISEKKSVGQKIAEFYLQGAAIPWEEIYLERKVASYPLYPFEKTVCWLKDPATGFSVAQRLKNHHVIGNQSILPAAMTFSLFAQQLGNVFSLSEIRWIHPIKASVDIITQCNEDTVTIFDEKDEDRIFVCGEKSSKEFPKHIRLPDSESDLGELIFSDALYEGFRKNGYQYHGAYQKLLWVKRFEKSAIGAIFHDFTSPFQLDPSLIDSSMQLAITLKSLHHSSNAKKVYVPFSLQNFYYRSISMSSLNFSSIKIIKEEGLFVTYDIVILNDKLDPFIYLENLTSILVDPNQMQRKKQYKRSNEEKEENVAELQFL